MGEIKFIGGLAMLVVFVIAIMSYVGNFGLDNDVAVDFNDDAEFNSLKSKTETSVSSFRSDVNSSSKAFFETGIDSGDETTRTGGAFKGNILSIPKVATNILSTVKLKVFGNDSNFGVIFTMIISFFTLVAGLYVWKTWKGGNPD